MQHVLPAAAVRRMRPLKLALRVVAGAICRHTPPHCGRRRSRAARCHNNHRMSLFLDISAGNLANTHIADAGWICSRAVSPTQVAVSNTGDVFVADGYCDSRVAQFRSDGSYVRDFRLPRVRAAIASGCIGPGCCNRGGHVIGWL